MALLLVLLLSIESFGAIVSDNDGSAFITKAEFDSLKNDFQAQINSYNTSIDSKIDGAIAAYLSGIRVSQSNSYNLFFAGENTHFMNGVITPEYVEPDLSLTVNVGGRSVSSSNNKKQYGVGFNVQYIREWETNQTHRKPLVKLRKMTGTNTQASVNGVYWDGCALRYREKIIYGKSIGYNYSDLGSWDQSVNKRLLVKNFFYFRNIGYQSSINTANLIDATFDAQYKSGNNWATQTQDSTRWNYNSLALQVELDEYNGATKDHLHVINYDDRSWEVYNEQFLKTASTSSSSSVTEKTIYDFLNDGKYLKSSGYYIGHYKDQYNANGSVAVEYSNGSNRIASVGKLTSTWSSENIYQMRDTVTRIYKKAWDVDNLNILGGMPAFGAEKDDTVTWNVYFPSLTCYISDTSQKTNPENVEVRIYVATTPFSSGVDIDTTKGKYIKFLDASGVEQNYIDTKNRKATLNFTMEDSGFIYIKCIPTWETGDYINKKWDIEMSLEDEYKVVTLTEQY